MISQVLTTIFIICFNSVVAKKVHYIHWNQNNPMFRIDNTDHIVDVNAGNLPWEYDQVNIICPVSKPGQANYDGERHVIYSVSQAEYESCRITNPKPRIVAICNRPHRLMYFTITFRSFTPTPGGLEFHPGQDYYFISTSSRNDLHRRVGGGCSSHNMRMIFKVHDNRVDAEKKAAEEAEELAMEKAIDEMIAEEQNEVSASKTTTEVAYTYGNHRVTNKQRQQNGGDGEYIYYYHPRDLIEMENVLNSRRRNEDDSYESNEIYGRDEQSLKYTSSASTASSSWLVSSILLVISLLHLRR